MRPMKRITRAGGMRDPARRDGIRAGASAAAGTRGAGRNE
jgi:hypothetical protein